jgi:hypothetical protein
MHRGFRSGISVVATIPVVVATTRTYAPDVLRLPEDRPICSAKGCRAPATYALAWNNPKLHTPDRRKTWLACDEHRPTLSEFLDRRGFLRDVTPLG